MEYRFQLISIKPSLKDKTIHLAFTLDIDEETVNSNVIYLMDSSPRAIVPMDVVVDGRSINLVLKDWPVANHPYSLVITPDSVKSITGDKLESILPSDVTFKSEITSKVEIISPKNFETANGAISMRWKETGTKLVYKYYIETARDNYFCVDTQHYSMDKTADKPTDDKSEQNEHTCILPAFKEPGQHYIRIRVADANGYGEWSPVTTVTCPDAEIVVPNPQPADKPLPGVPTITDYTKQEAEATVSTGVIKNTYTYDSTPSAFPITFSQVVDDSNAVVTMERESI